MVCTGPFPHATPKFTLAQDAMLLILLYAVEFHPDAPLADADLARGHPRRLCVESRAVMVDLCFASCHPGKFLFNYMGRIPHRSVIQRPLFVKHSS